MPAEPVLSIQAVSDIPAAGPLDAPRDGPAGRNSATVRKPAPVQLPHLLLSAADLAELLRVSTATVWRLRAAGKLPRPLDALGRQLLRWDATEVQRWVKAGMPPLKQWEAIDRQ
jgi:predicted DNA-binding transcriptional regulator AlpA